MNPSPIQSPHAAGDGQTLLSSPSSAPHGKILAVGVELPDSPYDVLIGEGLLDDLGSTIRENTKLNGRCALITDDRVGPIYADRARASLHAAGFDATLHEVPAGESTKCMSCVERLCDCMLRSGHDRQSFVAALGGGVVGDLAGFVAAVYFRGIPVVQIPTTIVAQVDSSIGGKTGINAREAKNAIGAFHQPSLVISDPLTLLSLPQREFAEGFAEIVKHAVIRDSEMLETIRPGARDALTPLIAHNVAIKAAIVASDVRETSGHRALLNFGHTIGHAIETAAGYGEFLHGEAISIGIAAALRLSKKLVGLSDEEEARVLNTLRSLNLPVSLEAAPPRDAILSAMKTDKKFEAGKIRFILTPHLGSAFVSADVELSDIQSLWD